MTEKELMVQAEARESLPSPAGRWGKVERVIGAEAGPIWDPTLTRKDPEGILEVAYDLRGAKTIARRVYRQGSTRFSQSLSSAGPDVAYNMVVQTGGGFIEGERYTNAFDLAENTHAVVSTQAPTCVFKCEHGRVIVQETVIDLAPGSVFEYYQDPLIPYQSARLRQHTVISLIDGASCIYFDGVTGGWSESGDPFRYTDLFLNTEVYRDHELVLLDRLLLDPSAMDLTRLGYFEGLTNFDSATLVDERVGGGFIEMARRRVADFCEERGFGEGDVRWGISALDKGGCVMRLLGRSGATNREVALELAQCWREMRGFHPLSLRRNDTRHH